MIRKLILAIALVAPITAFGQCRIPVQGSAAVYVNNATTGTTLNTVTSLDSSGNAIVYPHAQTVGVIGVAVDGAGAVPNSGVCVQSTGEVPIIADGAVTAQHWTTTSTATDGQIHDTGTACTALPPSGVEVIGCAVRASTGAGVAALISLKGFISASGITGTATTNCTIKGSGTNTVSCGAGTDDATYLKPKEILNIEANPIAYENTTAAGTYTVSKLACVTASNTVGDCTSAANNIFAIGVNLAKDGSLPVTQISGKATITSTASVTFTAGDFVCTDASNAATVIDNSTSPCPAGQRQIGLVAATDGGNTTSHTVLIHFSSPSGTQTIASGTSAMGTGAISSGTCATVVTTAATGTATTDVIEMNPNGDPTGVTGYGPSASGSLYIWKYPTTNNVNFKVCNNTSGSITPGALTLNWRVVR